MRIEKKDKLDFELPKDFNMKFIDFQYHHTIYKIIYTYKNLIGNNKENHRYLIADDFEDAKFKFIEYINHYNMDNKYRAVSNVKILDTINIGTVTK